MPSPRIAPLARELERSLPDRPFSVEFWDGTRVAGTRPGPRFRVGSPEAIARVLRAPGELGLGRAYVADELDVDDMDAVIALLGIWEPPALTLRARLRLALAAARAGGLRRPPPPPAAELQPRGRLHSRERDALAVRHHYDVSNDFFALFLDESMTYSCALFKHGAGTLEEAQEAKLELICRKLDLQPGARLLNHGITRLGHYDYNEGDFTVRFVFPDGKLLHLERVVGALERAGLEARHVESLREDYVETLRHWAARLEENLNAAVRLAGPE